MDKATLRYSVASARAKLSIEEVQDYSTKLCQHLLPLILPAKTILCYSAKGQEADINSIMEQLLRQKCRVLLPCIEGNLLVPRQIQSLADLETGPYNIFQPSRNCPVVAASEIDLVLVPGIAFDRQGHRLGRGAGFYDRFLNGFRGKKIGIGYELQLLEKIPYEPHDVLMDSFITEKNIYHFP